MNSTKNWWNRTRSWLTTVALVTVAVLTTQSAVAATQTQNLAYIDALDSPSSGSGTFPEPTTNPAFAGYSFFPLPVANITAANIGPGGVCGASGCDTILLNVASSGLGCSVSAILTATQKVDLVAFVSNGGKLIISDSECGTQDYSWLPYPFTTANPGAMGAQGTLTIVENNALSSNNSTDPKYIDAGMLSTQTDAIGDMNVMTTLDSNWCLDMSGTNALQVTGPVHTYARYGKGLLIYNGMDTDYMDSNTVPSSTAADGNLAKIWLQELQVPFNPTPVSALPCGATVVGVNIAPLTAVTNLNITQYTVTATLKDLLNNPEPGHTVTFTVLSGPNADASGVCSASPTCVSDSNGEVSFTYTSNGSPGIDEIQACFIDNQQQQRCSQVATNEWSSTQPPSSIVDFSGSGGGGATSPLELIFGALCLPLIWLQNKQRAFQPSDLVTALLAVLIVAIAVTAQAAGEPGWYVGAGVGGAHSNTSASDYDAALLGLGYTATSTIDDSNTGWKLFGGDTFTPNWGVEGSYVNFGDVKSHTTVSSPALPSAVEQQQFVDDAATVHPYSVDGFAVAAKGTVPLNGQFALFAKAGVFFWQADIKVDCNGCASTVNRKKSKSGTDWTGGVGLGYNVNRNVGLRIEFERYATDRDDVDFYSAGLEYRF